MGLYLQKECCKNQETENESPDKGFSCVQIDKKDFERSHAERSANT